LAVIIRNEVDYWHKVNKDLGERMAAGLKDHHQSISQAYQQANRQTVARVEFTIRHLRNTGLKKPNKGEHFLRDPALSNASRRRCAIEKVPYLQFQGLILA
jgi:hypothetical protein